MWFAVSTRHGFILLIKISLHAFDTFCISAICALSNERKYPLFSAKSLDRFGEFQAKQEGAV
jgi:hypothetical protein